MTNQLRNCRRSLLAAIWLVATLLVGAHAYSDGPASVDEPKPYGATPSPQQLAWHNREFYAFVHFNMNTFTGAEWGQGNESPDRFNPTQLDCRQWWALFKDVD